MSRGKLKRFIYNKQNKYVIQHDEPLYESIKGNWNQSMFGNNNPITLEVGCGRGEYTTGLAELFPDRNFIGVDIKGSRLWNGAYVAEQCGLSNTAFLRTQVICLDKVFGNEEVDEIWITFPDPRPRESEERKRLVSDRFLNLYKMILKKGGFINLKTDSYSLYLFTLRVLQRRGLNIQLSTDDLYNSRYIEYCHNIQTTYERKFLTQGVKINYLRFGLT